MNVKNKKLKASYTIEAAIYIPFVLFLMIQSLKISIDYLELGRDRVMCEVLQQLNTVEEFYIYQILEEAGRELENGAT